MAEAWDGFDRLPEPGVNDALDSFVASKHIDIPALVRIGARLSSHNVLAFAYPGGIKYRNVETGQRWAYAGSEWSALKMIAASRPIEPRTVIVAEGETDAARLTMLWPGCDVAALPAGALRFAPTWPKQLDAYARVLVALDSDTAGEAGAAKIAEHVPHAVRFAPPAGLKDWGEYVGDPPELPAAGERRRIGRTASDLLRTAPEEPDWVIPGVLARTWTIKVAAREKVGKGTLILSLLGCVERGEPTVFGPATEPATAVIFTEEPEDSIREKVANAGLDRALIVYGWELDGLDWQAKVDALVGLATDGGHGGIFCDNISRSAAVSEEAGVELARAVELLGTRARKAGMWVIVDHHHRKAAGKLDDMSRGGTALAGAVENNIELERVGDWESRMRRVSSRGRVSSTIWVRTIELSEDGRFYSLVADADEPQDSRTRDRLATLEEFGADGTTVSEFASAIGKTKETARRTLREFVASGQARVDDSRPARYVVAVPL